MKQNTLFEEMATFALVVEEGSFTKAAQKLGRSKAYVSQQISRLEEAVETKLLFRTTRKLEMTEAGRACLDSCRNIMLSGADVLNSVASLKGEMVGTLRLTAPVSLGEIFCRDIVFSFVQSYPDIRIELDLQNLQRDLIAEGFDLAIRATHTPQEDLVAIAVGELVEVICASPSYLSERGEPTNPRDMSQHSCIINQHQAHPNRWMFEREGQRDVVMIESTVSINHYSLVKQAILDGQGVARLPHYIVKEELAAGRLVALYRDYEPEKTPIYVVYPYHGALPLRTRTMVDFVVDWLRNELVFS